MTQVKLCQHLAEAKDIQTASEVCEECVKLGDEWMHLRLCLTCGNVACCDDSKNKHATKHFHSTGHPVIQSLEEGENWKWCYVDQIGVM